MTNSTFLQICLWAQDFHLMSKTNEWFKCEKLLTSLLVEWISCNTFFVSIVFIIWSCYLVVCCIVFVICVSELHTQLTLRCNEVTLYPILMLFLIIIGQYWKKNFKTGCKRYFNSPECYLGLYYSLKSRQTYAIFRNYSRKKANYY